MTSQKLQTRDGENSKEKLTSFVADSLVKAFPSLEKETDLMTLVGQCFSRLREPPSKLNHAFYFLRMSKAYYITKTAKHLKPSSMRFMNWGMMQSGFCVTANTLEYPKIENEFSLSDILENNPEEETEVRRDIALLFLDKTVDYYGFDSIDSLIEYLSKDNENAQIYSAGTPNCGFHKKRPNPIVIKAQVAVSSTILASKKPAILIVKSGNWIMRHFTALECWRLQARSDEHFYRAKAVCSKAQLYKQAGNSVTVSVVKHVAENYLMK